jgi:hypothetical protein
MTIFKQRDIRRKVASLGRCWIWPTMSALLVAVMMVALVPQAHATCHKGFVPNGKGCMPKGAVACGPNGYCKPGTYCVSEKGDDDDDKGLCSGAHGPLCPGNKHPCSEGSACAGRICYEPHIAHVCNGQVYPNEVPCKDDKPVVAAPAPAPQVHQTVAVDPPKPAPQAQVPPATNAPLYLSNDPLAAALNELLKKEKSILPQKLSAFLMRDDAELNGHTYTNLYTVVMAADAKGWAPLGKAKRQDMIRTLCNNTTFVEDMAQGAEFRNIFRAKPSEQQKVMIDFTITIADCPQ